jgi:hypothetical protein
MSELNGESSGTLLKDTPTRQYSQGHRGVQLARDYKRDNIVLAENKINNTNLHLRDYIALS